MSPAGPTYDEFLRHVTRALAAPTRTWRVGQTFFNVLYAGRPDLADAVAGTDLDPFHRDDRLPAFLTWVRNAWDRDPDDPPFDGTSLKISLEQYRRGEVTDL